MIFFGVLSVLFFLSRDGASFGSIHWHHQRSQPGFLSSSVRSASPLFSKSQQFEARQQLKRKAEELTSENRENVERQQTKARIGSEGLRSINQVNVENQREGVRDSYQQNLENLREIAGRHVAESV